MKHDEGRVVTYLASCALTFKIQALVSLRQIFQFLQK